mmetsp:Transcript_57733/g.162832  ORF Transcript_57733/g.162832 Transcript_57733/m.162832 type:complete len:232 (+) Transcript_57733:290-985(+)
MSSSSLVSEGSFLTDSLRLFASSSSDNFSALTLSSFSSNSSCFAGPLFAWSSHSLWFSLVSLTISACSFRLFARRSRKDCDGASADSPSVIPLGDSRSFAHRLSFSFESSVTRDCSSAMILADLSRRRLASFLSRISRCIVASDSAPAACDAGPAAWSRITVASSSWCTWPWSSSISLCSAMFFSCSVWACICIALACEAMPCIFATCIASSDFCLWISKILLLKLRSEFE